MPTHDPRIESLLEHALVRVLLEHEGGVMTALGYRLVEQRVRMPAAWRQPIPFGKAYEDLAASEVDWHQLSADDLTKVARTEPKWRNRLRQVVRHLRDRTWMVRGEDHGVWMLTTLGREKALAATAMELGAAEWALLVDHPSPLEDVRHAREGGVGAPERVRVMREIWERRGQPAFRAILIEVYAGRCAVSNCDAEAVLEAAHLIPVADGGGFSPSNGLLLRADVHTLFDLHLLGIEPSTRKVYLAHSLHATDYWGLNGRRIVEPSAVASRPDAASLEFRWNLFTRYGGPDR